MTRLSPIFLLLGLMLAKSPPLHAKPGPGEVAFFENKIRPILVKHCYECHSADAKELGGKLLLDTRDGVLKGGESGPALIAGNPAKSLIIQALKYDNNLQMPPEKPLPEQVIKDFELWIQKGAVDPRKPKAMPQVAADSSKGTKSPTAGEKDSPAETLWSLRPVQNPAIPKVKQRTWPRDPLDYFVLSRIEAKKLTPARDAEPRTLARRLYYDLIGLPPTLEEITAFAEDHAEHGDEATARLVDQLLVSPQFGEHWGRYWLDVARYGESNGNDGLGRNPTFPHAWRYRDYVIRAFNHDLPFDRFIAEQIAGDLLETAADAERDLQLVATGFLAMGSKPAKAMNTNFDMDVVADQIDLIGRAVLGLTVGCARCHDHKFDPIPTRDYYALAGIFTSTETMWGIAANEGLTAPVTDLHVLKTPPHVLPPKDFVETVITKESNTGKPKAIPKPKWPIGTPLAMGVRDKAKPADAKINIKGDVAKLGEAVPRGFLSAISLPGMGADESELSTLDSSQSGRVHLAQWLTHAEHPLTPRVLANRIWQQLMGEGIVRTPDDFGVYGEPPSDPLLLDHLATRLVRDGWSWKKMIRAIVLSRTYQLTSQADAKLVQADPQNLLFARHDRRRLTAEALRDSMLYSSGQLELRPGDGSLIRHRDIMVNLAGNLHQPSRQRSIYLCYLRSSPPPELAAFDLPEFTTVIGKRDVSTVPGQALHLYNSPFVNEQAVHFAKFVMNETADPLGRAQLVWQRAYGREASDREVKQALELVRWTAKELKSELSGWQSLCQALLASNEFRYVD